MELRHLKYFVKVAEERHFGRAAAALRIAQPPLSRQIRDLEDELGARLLDRSARGVALTPAGRVFYREARDILARATFAADLARRAAKGEGGELRVGHLAGPGASIIPRATADFRRAKPGAELTLTEMNAADLAGALKSGEIDAAYVSEPDDNGPYAGMPYKALVRYPIRLGLSPGHRLGGRAVIPWRELCGERFWMYSQKTFPDYRGAMTGLCRRHGFDPLIAGEVASATAMLTAIGSGSGVALLLPPYACWAPPGVVLRPLSPEGAKAGFGLVWNPAAAGKLLDAWLDALKAAAIADAHTPATPKTKRVKK